MLFGETAMTLCKQKLSGSKKGQGVQFSKFLCRHLLYTILLDKLDWTLLSDRRRKNLRIAVFRCLPGLFPQGLQNYVTLVQNKHVHQTRGSLNGNISPTFKPNTEAGRHTFLFREAKAWNKLPTEATAPLPISAAVFKSRFQSV